MAYLRILLRLLAPPLAFADVFSLSFRDVLASARAGAPSSLFCESFSPRLLGEGALPAPLEEAPSPVQQWQDFYDRRWRRFLLGEAGGVVLAEIEGESKFRVLRASGTELRNGNQVLSQGWNATTAVPVTGLSMGGALVWAEPPKNLSKMVCERRIGRGRLLVLANWFPGNYGHWLHDTLPLLFWLRRFIAGPTVRFGLIDDWLHRTVIRWLDPDLNDRIVWLTLNELTCIAEPGSLVVAQYAVPDGHSRRRSHGSVWNLRNPSLVRAFALEVDRLKGGTTVAEASAAPSSLLERERQKRLTPIAIFYSRRSAKSTHHGRTMTLDHEQNLLRVLHDALARHGRSEHIVVFNGEDANGRRLSYEMQFKIFRRASLVVGPHGSGLANVLWMNPHLRTPAGGGESQANGSPLATTDDCSRRPAVLEFITNEELSAEGGNAGESSQVQPGSSGKSYYSLLGGVPWVQYYHLFLCPNSTNAAIWVNMDKFASALDIILEASSLESRKSAMGTTNPPSEELELGRKPNKAARTAEQRAVVSGAPAKARPKFVYVLASHKTGSTFLWAIFKGLVRISGQCLLDGERPEASEEGIPLASDVLRQRCPKGGVLFTRRTLHPGYQREVATMVSKLGGCLGIFQTRNPLDVVVSQYQSFTRNHAIPPSFSEEKRLEELKKREKDRQEGINIYAAKHWHEIRARLDATRAAEESFRAVDGCSTFTSTYESMTERPLVWVKRLASFLQISPEPRMQATEEEASADFVQFAAAFEDAQVNAIAKRDKLMNRTAVEFDRTAVLSSTREGRVEERAIGRRQASFLLSKAESQKGVRVNETSHTAYFFPGAHLSHLQTFSLPWLY